MLSSLKRNQQPLLLLVACLVAAALPLSRLNQSLWRDEASSIWFARLPLVTLLTELCDPHPAGYYLLLKGWLLAGEQETWLRLPSLFAAVLAVALTYRIGQMGCGRRCAWLAALLLALHPLQSWYAAEVRMYALLQCLGLLMVWLGWRLLQDSTRGLFRWRQAAIYWLATLIAFGLDYAALAPFSLLQLVWLTQGRSQPGRWLSLQVAALLSAILFWLKGSQLQALGHNYLPGLVAIQAGRLGLELTPTGAAQLLLLLLSGLMLGSLAVVWFWSRRPAYWSNRPPVRLLLTGWLLLLLMAALPRAFTFKRQLVVLLPYLALFTAYTLTKLPRPTGEFVAGLGLLITLLILPAHPREPWRSAVAQLVRAGLNQTAVVWVDDLSAPAFDYYVRRSPAATRTIPWVALFGRKLPNLPNLTPRPEETLWIVIAESPYRNLVALLPAGFYQDYQLLEERHQVGIGLYHYRRRTAPVIGRLTVAAPTHIAEWGLLLPSPLDTCGSGEIKR